MASDEDPINVVLLSALVTRKKTGSLSVCLTFKSSAFAGTSVKTHVQGCGKALSAACPQKWDRKTCNVMISHRMA